MRPRLPIDLVVVCLAWMVATATRGDASVLRVNPNGSGDATTVQGGIDLALSGDTLLVTGGAYPEHLVLQGKGLVIRGDSGPGGVILDGGYSGRILTVSRADGPVILENLDFRHGRMQGVQADNQGGAVASFASRLVVRHCAFHDNLASSLGAGIYASNFLPDLSSASAGPPPSVEVVGCRFESNFCGGDGGGMFVEEIPALVDGSTFSGNTGGGTGGGLGLLHGSHVVSATLFEGNHASSGGGIAYSGDGILTIEDSVFRENRADDLGGGCSVISAYGIEIAGSAFIGNRAFRGAGGSFRLTPVTGERIYWLGNEAEERGGGFYAAGAPVTLTAVTWLGNLAVHGASVTVLDAGVSVSRSIFGDPFPDAVDCQGASGVTGGCLVGAPGAGVCPGLSFAARLTIEPCASALDSLCTVPVLPECGPIGHAGAACGGCASPVRPLTWGRLKDLYR